MATIEYEERLASLMEEKEQLPAFLESGVNQLARVLRGPRPRQQVPRSVGYRRRQLLSNKQKLLPWQWSKTELPAENLQKTTTSRSSLPAQQKPPQSNAVAPSHQPTKPAKSHRAAAFVLASLPASPLLFADADRTQLPLRLLSDTVRHVLAGTAARTMSQAVIHPIDTVKTRLQVNKLTAPLQLQNWRRHSKAHKIELFLGSRRVLSLRNWLVQGPVDLYRGLSGAVLGTIPVALTYFATYEACKSFMEERGASGAASHLASAATGAVVSAFIRVPTDTLKHRAQAYIVPDIFQGARSIVAEQGIRGLYQGMLPTLLRDVPELALQFTLYESLRKVAEERRQVKKLRTWEHLLLGGISGGAAASATMPLDVAKTALQCGGSSSITSAFREVLREKGVPGLFAGMGPRVAQIALQGAVFFTLFEAWKAQLKPPPLREEEDREMAPKLWRKRRDHVWKRQFVIQ